MNISGTGSIDGLLLPRRWLNISGLKRLGLLCGTSKWFPPNNDDGKPKFIALVGAADWLKFCFESDIWIVFAVGSIFDAVIRKQS